MDKSPIAWMCPVLLTFEGVTKTSCPPEMQPEIEGTVAWHPETLGDSPDVTDKFGVTHKPYPLGPLVNVEEILEKFKAAVIASCKNERCIESNIHTDEDFAYDAGIKDCIKAIKKIDLSTFYPIIS